MSISPSRFLVDQRSHGPDRSLCSFFEVSRFLVEPVQPLVRGSVDVPDAVLALGTLAAGFTHSSRRSSASRCEAMA